MQALRGLYGCSNTCPHLGSSRRTTVHRQSRAPPAAHAAAGRPLQRPAFGLQLAAASGESVTGSGNGDPHISLALRSARAKLLSMLEETSDEGSNRTGPAIAAAVENLIKENPSLTPGLDTPEVGVGVWEVFHAPHIARISAALGTRFDPIHYTLLPGGAFVSNVRFSSPVLGTGWLSASGTLATQDEGAVRVTFTDFWVDRGDHLRRWAPTSSSDGPPGSGTPPWMDPVVETLGRALFIQQLSVFPVLYLDQDLSVFQFPPLGSNIAVRRVVEGR